VYVENLWLLLNSGPRLLRRGKTKDEGSTINLGRFYQPLIFQEHGLSVKDAEEFFSGFVHYT
jgi:hypothetical protein